MTLPAGRKTMTASRLEELLGQDAIDAVRRPIESARGLPAR